MEGNFKENVSFREDLKLEYLKLIYEYGYDKVLSNQEEKKVEAESQDEKEIGGMKK